MIKLSLSLVALALAASACVDPEPGAERAGEAQEAVTAYADMTAVKAAADSGTCVPGAIVVGGVPQYPVLADGVWSMSAEGGDYLSRGTCLQIKAGTILTAADYGGEYEGCIEAPAGIFQLVEVDGAAMLVGP